MDARGNTGNSPEKANPRKRSFAELCTRRPERSHHLPLHLNSESAFAQAPSESLNRNFPPPLRFRRYEGDGLDLRRPIMSERLIPTESRHSQSQTQHSDAGNVVIDLTDEPDISAEHTLGNENVYETSFGFVPGSDLRTLVPARTPEVIDLEDDDDDNDNDNDVILQEVVARPDVEFVSAQPRRDRPPESRLSGQSRNNPPSWLSGGLVGLAGFIPQTQLSGLHHFTQTFLNSNSGDRSGRQSIFDFLDEEPPQPQTDWLRAGAMDFTQVAFELGNPREVTRPATATMYEAPDTPPDGFTRTVKEDDVVVCANCDHELGAGDNPLQKQIWVIRKCGHAYCGACVTTAQKGKKKLVSKCVANGCGNPIKGGKSCMFMLYI